VKANVENIDAISTEYSRNLRLRLGDQGRGVEVSGVSPVFGELRSMVPAAGGRFIDPIDMEPAAAGRLHRRPARNRAVRRRRPGGP